MTMAKVGSPRTDLWISCPNPNSQAWLRLFCFPYAGGGTTQYHGWAKTLSPSIELYAVRFPGRESRLREAPHVRIEPLVEELSNALSPYFDKPFAFFGHSMGALVSFELTRLLSRQNGTQPLCLIVSGHRAPHLPERETPLYHLPDNELVHVMQERYNGIPQFVTSNPEILELFLPTIRADVTVLDTYCYREEGALSLPIAAFGGYSDPSVTQYELDQWGRHTTTAFSLRMFSGDHFYIQSAQNEMLQALNVELAHYLAR
jgi:medium-chain acyl-[acyl-carrier-protein] hydrolase